MQLLVENAAALWYKEEMGLKGGECLRIFVKLGGCGSVHSGFSLGITQDTPVNPGLEQEIAGIRFYMEEVNMWYMDGKSLHIVYDEKLDEAVLEVK